MKKKNQDNSQPSFLKGTSLLLFGVLTVMLSGYFAWSDSTGFNMLFKLVSRLLMTMAIYLIYRRIAQRGAIPSFGWKNGFSPLLYLVYLGLGLLSFLWSTDVGYSALQWCMDAAGLVFAYYFVACFVMLDRYFPNHSIRIYKTLAQGIFSIHGCPMCATIIFRSGYFSATSSSRIGKGIFQGGLARESGSLVNHDGKVPLLAEFIHRQHLRIQRMNVLIDGPQLDTP